MDGEGDVTAAGIQEKQGKEPTHAIHKPEEEVKKGNIYVEETYTVHTLIVVHIARDKYSRTSIIWTSFIQTFNCPNSSETTFYNEYYYNYKMVYLL